MNQLAVIPVSSPPAGNATDIPPVDPEVSVLARESAAAYERTVAGYKKLYKCSIQEALAKADDPPSCQIADPANRPADQMTWFDLQQLGERSPELALQCWQGIRKQALEELQTGHRSAEAMEAYGNDHCWGCARFLAIRDDLAAEWQPRNGIERQLIDVMAQAQTAMLSWISNLAIYSGMACSNQKADIRDHGKWTPARVSESQATEQAAGMFDRFNRIFLRTLRALRDLRRYSPTVIVQHAGQVNVGQQQVNVTKGSIE